VTNFSKFFKTSVNLKHISYEMIYRRFGKTELKMPVISFGCMRSMHGWQDIRFSEIPDESQANLEAMRQPSRIKDRNQIVLDKATGVSRLASLVS
jgi:hypothetical protein